MPRPQQSTQIYDENVHGAGARRTRYGTRSQSSKSCGTGQRRARGDSEPAVSHVGGELRICALFKEEEDGREVLPPYCAK